jgi:cytochrome c oxidase subunit 1
VRWGSTDHKVVARQYLWAGLGFLAVGGLLAMLIRWQWGWPGRPVPVFGWAFPQTGGALTPPGYTGVFTMHGLLMVFFAITPLLIGSLGHFVIPLAVGARSLAFPRLSAWSFRVFALGGALVLASFGVRLGAATAGWTSYPPLSAAHEFTPGAGQTLVMAGVVCAALSSFLSAVNFAVTVVRCRAPGMTWGRLPLTVWGLFFTSVLNLLFIPVVGAATGMVLLDRVVGTRFFMTGAAVVGGGGDPLLYQHLFWMFGHPEVYILILPAWGMVGDFVAFFSRRPAHGYRGTVLAMGAVTALSGLVYAHHLFTSGMAPMLGRAFMTLTLIISLPAMVMFLNWLMTLWQGSVRLTAPMLAVLGTMVVFGLGGITGLALGAVATDIPLHATMWVVGHFHLTMAAASFLAVFAGLYFWFPKMFGRQLHEGLAKGHVVASTVLFLAVFSGQLAAGYAGQLRRLYDPYQYEYLKHLLPLNQWTSVAAFALALVQGLFVVNLVWTLRRGRAAEANPWQVGTLEWTCAPSPPPENNYEQLPEVRRGPHTLSQPEVHEQLGRDWLGQAEALPGEPPPLPPGEGRGEGAEETQWFGAVIGLGAWAMFFAAVAFTVGYLRLRAPFPTVGALAPPRLLPGIGLLLLACGSGLLHSARKQLHKAPTARNPALWRIFAALGLGVAFLTQQAALAWAQWENGLQLPSGGAYASAFYGLMSVHALHVAAGLLGLARLELGLTRGQDVRQGLRLWNLYWHFVTVTGLLFFAAVYLP